MRLHVSLRRELGLADAVGIGVGAIVGAGIFVVTGVAAGIAGPAFLVSLLISALAAACNALSSAQLAAAYPYSGGAYEYGYRVLGPWAGFTAGWMFLASKIAAAGTVALGLAGYLAPLAPAIPPQQIAIAAIIVFTVVNLFRIRVSSRLNLAIITVSVGSLILFVLTGIGSFDAGNLEPFAPTGARGILEAAAILFFAYTGYARIATLAEEVRDPAHTIPRAIMITLGIVVLLYFAVAIVAAGAVGTERLAATAAPLRVAALSSPYRGVAAIISIGGVTAMLGVIMSQLLGLSRMSYAMSRRGDLPRRLTETSPQYGVPRRAVLVIGVLAALVAATGALRVVASAAAFAILVYYAIANTAALRMPRELQRYPVVVPVVGLASCIVLALSLTPRVILIGIVILAIGSYARWMFRPETAGPRNR